ncbi:hypothetical protein IM660_11955 [Ruania alkalisoli]|uniref:Beta-galactosidase trimerisation domain-containing protein n=1 Tax=Ruania alkalisoli TaxID=2779775 RepID=A0A7M1SPC2_9MICO|nr:alpha-amylase family protein [Ruania alkalisoli]QOR69409.1 hypothetical protein IM660_11955 [Ruania alkalisoli]
MREPWWHTPFRTFQTNLREIDAGLDVEATLDAIEDYGADTWLLSVGGIIANYPSELDCQSVNPALVERDSGDLIEDAVAAARARGIRLLGRMDFSKIDARRAEANPQWCFVSPDGEPQIYNGYRSVCPSGEYYQSKSFDVISEVLARYDLAGFFFNWMSFNERDYSRRYWGVCHCEPCLAGFRAFAPGTEHPRDPDSPGYRTWQRFAAGVLDDLTAKMRAHVRALAPEAGLILGDRADITFHEANNAVGRPLWHHATAEAVSVARSGDPAQPVFVNAVSFVDMPYRWAGEDPHHFGQYLLQAIAHGAQPSTYIMGGPADSPFEALDVGRQITRFHRDHADVYAGLTSTARVALVRTSATEEIERRTSEFQGCYLSLVERHVPFDVLRQDRLDQVAADRYDLVVIPDGGALRPEEVSALEGVLAAGGTVALTGDSGWSEGALQLAGDVATQKAVFATEESVRSLHLPVGENEGDLTPVVGGFAMLEPGPQAHSGWHAWGRALYGPPEKCYGHDRTGHPGWVSADVGPGRLVVLPWRPGLVYREVGLSRVRDAWVATVLELTRAEGGLAVGTELPEQVQIVPGRSSAGPVIHLLNRSGDASQRFVQPLPIAPGTVRLRLERDPTRARALVAGVDLNWTREGEEVVIHTPQIGAFDVLNLTGA